MSSDSSKIIDNYKSFNFESNKDFQSYLNNIDIISSSDIYLEKIKRRWF